LNLWASAKSLANESFIKFIDETQSYKKAPSALLDFRNVSIEGERPKDAFYALLMLQRELTHDGLKAKFPLFDFACVMYLYKKGLLTPERIKALFPSDALDAIGVIVDFLSNTTYGSLVKAGVNLFFKKSAEKYLEKFKLERMKRKLKVEDLERIDQ